MNTILEELVSLESTNNRPVLSAFVNLKHVDHSLRKIKTILIKTQHQLKKNGEFIPVIDEILRDNKVQGRELEFDEGLGDVNIAFYAVGNHIYKVKINFGLNDDVKLLPSPYILPIIRSDYQSIQVLTATKKTLMSYQLDENGHVSDSNIQRYDFSQEISDYDSQAMSELSRKHQMHHMRKELNFALEKFSQNFSPDDTIMAFANAQLLGLLKKTLSKGMWRKNFISEAVAIENTKELQKHVESLSAKYKVNWFAPNPTDKTVAYDDEKLLMSQNPDMKKIKKIMIRQDYIENSLLDHEEKIEFNNYCLKLIKKGVEVVSYKKMQTCFQIQSLI